MPGVRDHEPIIIEEFNGWWDRGDPESAPSDHFTVADNIQYFNSGVETRVALDKFQVEFQHLTKILRTYNYVMQNGQSLLVLVEGGKIYHVINGAVSGPGGGPILNIPAMEDFGFVSIAGRAYISPFKTITTPQGASYEIGISGEFVYVYKGDGVYARKAAGAPPKAGGGTPYVAAVPMLAYNSQSDGEVTKGIHVFGVSFNGSKIGTTTSTGGIRVLPVVEAPGGKQVQIDKIPKWTVGFTRTLVMTKAIEPDKYKADTTPLAFFVVQTWVDNTTDSFKVNFSDEQLLTPFTPNALDAPGTGALLVDNTDIEGFCDFGFHLVGVVYETDTGYMSAPGPEYFGGQTYIDVKRSVRVRQIPVAPPELKVIKRHLVSTKWIPEYNGDQKGYQFFFIPKGTLENNTATELVVNYYDSDLLSDASHLLDNFSEIPAGVRLNTYHSRMVLVGDPSFPKDSLGVSDTTKPDNRSVAWLSAPGEPEAINQVDGLVVTPLDGNPLTNAQEFRDVLYLFKKNRTYAYSDNFDEPATWQEEVLDQGVGAPVHGIATVLDSGGVNIDFLIVVDWSGLMLFNGTYARPELSWKIEDYWKSLDRNIFRQIQIVNDTQNKKLWIVLPEPNRHHVLFADYGNGLDAKNIRWAKWIFASKMSCITLIDTDKVILGSSGTAVTLEDVVELENS